MVGEQVGNFRLVKKLGAGGMGEVWLGEQQNVRTQVAIKLLHPHISTEPQHIERFFNEAIAASRIKHAGIVKIFDVGMSSSGRAYLVMELLEGETLTSRIVRSGRLPLGQLAELGRQISRVVDATHRAGITHRDLKPDNIFIVPDTDLDAGERVKILDFGIAKLGSVASLTGTGMGGMGSPSYMAPEQWRDAKNIDWRVDVYSLGCLTFQMATGRPPFAVSSIADACTKHLTEPPPSLRAFVPELPVELDMLIQRMMAKEPAQRPASMAEIVDAFAALIRHQPTAMAATIAPTLAPAPIAPSTAVDQSTLGGAAVAVASMNPAKSRGRGFALAAVGLAAVAGIAIAVTRRGDDAHTVPEPQPLVAPAPAVAAPPSVDKRAPLTPNAPAPSPSSPAQISPPAIDPASIPTSTTPAPTSGGEPPRISTKRKMSFDSVPKPMLLGVMASRKSAIIECATTAGFHGVLTVHVVVSAEGHVRETNRDSWHDRALGACVGKAVATAQFPATTDGGTFDYPLLF